MTARNNKWFLYGPFIAAGVILLLWFALWRSGAEAMKRSLAEFREAQAADGIAVDYAPLKPDGFPFFLRGVVDKLSVVKGGTRYECERLFIDALPYALDRIIFSCGGEQRLTTPKRVWMINAPDARASIERDRKRGWMVRAETGKASASAGSIEARIDAATINAAPHERGSQSIDASMRFVGVAVTGPQGGYALDRLDAAGAVSAALPGDGREIKILGLEAVIGETIVKAEGAVFIPVAGDPQGRFDTRIEKPAGLAHLLSDAKLLTAEEAVVAQNGLAMLAVASGGAVSAPVELGNGELRLAGFRLARLSRSPQP